MTTRELLVGPALVVLYRLDLADRSQADHDANLVEDVVECG